MMEWFALLQPRPTYGRLAYIHCDGKPAIELLEIVAPEPLPGSSRDVGERQKKLTRTP
jgi:hypothetical protein